MRLDRGILKQHDAEWLCNTLDLWGPTREAFLMWSVEGCEAEQIAEVLAVSRETALALVHGAEAAILGHPWELQRDRDLIECLRNRKRTDPTAAVVELRSPVIGIDDLRVPQDTLPQMLDRMKGGGELRRRRGDDLRPQRSYDVSCGRPGRNWRFKSSTQEVRALSEREAAMRAAELYGWETVYVRRSGPDAPKKWSCYDAAGRVVEGSKR